MNKSRYSLLAWMALAFTLIVIIWGAFVRASGSGAGCGNHWPLCKGGVWSIETFVELTHRLTSGIVVVLIATLLFFAFRLFPRGHVVRLGATLSAIFIVTEALVGAGLVKFELVAGDASLGRAMFMSVHLVNTFVLLGVMALTAWWASGGSPIDLHGRKGLAWICVACLVVTLVLGISGAIAALGDTLFPTASLSAGLRQDFNASNIFLRLRIFHPVIAVADSLALLVASFFIRRYRRGTGTNYLTIALPLLVLLQLFAGLANVLLLTPIWMQLVHLALADWVWIALVLLTAGTLGSSEERQSVELTSTRSVVITADRLV